MELGTSLTSIATSAGTIIKNLFTSLADIFYANGNLTIFGYALFFGLFVGLVLTIINFVRKLLHFSK